MEKIHLENMIKSFFLGLFIGVILQFYDHSEMQLSYRIIAALASGSIGFIIGFITEWVTSILPISIANARSYFFINNFIALTVTALIMVSLLMITNDEMENKGKLMPTLLIVLVIICAANLFDYMMYRRAQKKLNLYKELLKNNKL
ncbi:hypothetical protein M3231_00395 [Neobacillus mesonae]|nr:hypothetical protein [Neobacillus mesonae]